MTERSELEDLRREIESLNQRISAVEAAIIGRGELPLVPASRAETSTVAAGSAAGREARSETRAAAAPAGPPPLPPAPASPLSPAGPLPLPATPVRGQRDLEATIGLNWTGWVGAIVFVLGVLFFLKYAWDQGWINPTPTMRVIAAIATGVIVSGIGEWMHRRAVKVLAATLHGAGLAIVLASFFAAYALFEPDERVLDALPAFAGVAIAAAAGVALALHIDSIVLAIIALIGAYLAPFVLDTGQDRSAEMLGYLGVLSAVGWTLSWLRPRWVGVRALVGIGTYLSYAAWWSGMGQRNGHLQLATVWLAIYYLGFLAEMILTLRKVQVDEPILGLQTGTSILSLLNTAAGLGLLFALYPRDSHSLMLGIVALAVAGIQGAAALATRSRSFSVSSLLQFSALVTLAVPLILEQFSITLAWLALAVALAALAWELNLPAARGWAIILLLLSIARLFIFDGRSRGIIYSIADFSVSRWMLMAWGTAVLAHVIAWLRPGAPGRFPSLERRFAELMPGMQFRANGDAAAPGKRILDYAQPVAALDPRGIDGAGVFLTLVGTALFLASSATRYEGPRLTLLALLWLAPLVALAGRARHLGYYWHAAVFAALACVKWFALDGVQPLARDWEHPSLARALPPAVNLVALNGALFCILLGGMIVQVRKVWEDYRPQVNALVVWIALIALAMLNFEAIRAVDWIALLGGHVRDPAIIKHVVMSVLWALVGFAAVIAGFRRDIAPLRYAALLLLGATLLKILLIDMEEVKAVWRILSFIAVGGLLLAVSYIYHKQMDARDALRGGT